MLNTYAAELIIKVKKQMFRLVLTMSIVQVCLLFGITRKTFYKWRKHYALYDEAGLLFPLSSAPHTIWNKTPKWVEDLVVVTRKQHPELGCRRLAHLINAGFEERGSQVRVTYRTVHRILKRREDAPSHPLVEKAEKVAWRFFEAIAPHKIWQIDILYAFRVKKGQWMYVIAILDDHSRFVLQAKVTSRQRALDVVEVFREAVEYYGLPEMVLVDNGKQFKSKRFRDVCHALDIQVRYSGAYHPQTKGKIERFFRTLRKEYVRVTMFRSLQQVNQDLQKYLKRYNYVFTHAGIGDKTPFSRFLGRKGRPMPKDFDWAIHLCIRRLQRKVKADGCILLDKHRYFVGTHLASKGVHVMVEQEQITVFDGEEMVASFKMAA